MLIESPYYKKYLFTALAESPELMKALLQSATDERMDLRVDPERFTLRESVAHLADWETVFLERFKRIVTEDEPLLPNEDEGQRAIDQAYELTNWREQVELFILRRQETSEFLGSLPLSAWARTGNRPEIGLVSLFDLVMLLPLHDYYHLKQAREYLATAD